MLILLLTDVVAYLLLDGEEVEEAVAMIALDRSISRSPCARSLETLALALVLVPAIALALTLSLALGLTLALVFSLVLVAARPWPCTLSLARSLARSVVVARASA